MTGTRIAALAVGVLLGALWISCRPADAQRSGFVWWEGERPAETNFPKRSWLSPSRQESKLLSQGDWLSVAGKRGPEELFAVYKVDVPAAGEYNFWTRKFWKHGPFRWRFGNARWQVCGRDVALADDTFIRKFVNANWVYLGKVRLPAGKVRFELRLLAQEGQQATAAFDCFLLIPGPFMPNGKLKPGERWNVADEGYFPWEPQLDQFSDRALLDLRWMNEREAGEKGFVRRDGQRLVLADGRPVRFWAVNVGPNNIAQERSSIDYLARALAKRGVNMVRFHGPLFDRSGDPARLDAQALDNLHYLIAALKKQGIYTTISFYFPLWFDIKPGYGIPGFDAIENKRPFALLYFEPRMQQIHRSWVRQLLATSNPYTGLPIARDPAVAIIEIVNEDSFFFWTFSKRNIPPIHWQRLEALYAQWLARRYGSIDNALARWGRARLPDDNPAQGRVGLYEAWHMTRAGLKQGGPDKVNRVGDQVRFLAELQRRFYSDTVRYMKEELGYGGLVSCSNWKVADAPTLDAIERYTYTAGDVIDRHGYFGGKHKGDGASYSVRVGHTFESLSALTVPERLPIQFAQLEDYPQTITEIGWTTPNRYRADCTLLAAAYCALQGVDGVYFFAVGSNFLADARMNKFPVSCPLVAGSFPAAALIYRRGDVSEAPLAIREVLSLEDLYAMKGSAAVSASALDELRKRDMPKGGYTTGAVQAIDPLSFYVGKVVRAFGDDPTKSRQCNLPAFIDRQAKVVRSLTGELLWDWGRGILQVNTRRAQAVAGFLARAGKVELRDVAIECANEYGSAIVVSMDGEPIAEASKLLIQVTTDEQPYGFRDENGRITSMGGPPMEVRRVRATVTLKHRRPGALKVTAVDENGYATPKPVQVTEAAGRGAVSIRLAEDAVYHVVLIE